MKKQSKIYLAITVVVIILVATVAILQTKQSTKENDIKIGGLFALSGFASFAGEASQNGFLMAIEDSGLNIEHVEEDYQSDSKAVVTATNKLINVDGVSVVIGPEWIEFGEIVSPIANQKNVLFITPWNAKEFENEGGYYFSATPSDRSKIKKEIEYMISEGIDEIALVYHNNAFSLATIKMLKEELVNTDINIAIDLVTADDAQDYKTEIAKLKQKNIDLIYTALSTDASQGVFNKQIKELGVSSIILLNQSRAESDVFLKDYREYSQKMIYSANKQSSKVEEFKNKYINRFGKEPTAISAATAYDVTSLVLEAIKNGAQTTDEIKSYLLNIENYQGYSNNNLEFNKYGQVAEVDCAIKKINETDSEIIFEGK